MYGSFDFFFLLSISLVYQIIAADFVVDLFAFLIQVSPSLVFDFLRGVWGHSFAFLDEVRIFFAIKLYFFSLFSFSLVDDVVGE